MLQTVEKPERDGEEIIGILEYGCIFHAHHLGHQLYPDEDSKPETDIGTEACIIKQEPEDEGPDTHKHADKDSYLHELLPEGVGYQSHDNPYDDS